MTHIDGANKVFGAHQNVNQQEGEQDGHDPSTDESFNSLLGRELDELRAAKHNTTDVGKNVVGNDESRRQEEPNHSFKDVVHDEMGLYHNKVQGHVSPSEVGELEFIVAGLERGDEEDESYREAC